MLRSDSLQCFSLGANSEKMFDFVVVVGDTEFPCHRVVLSARSRFFEALFRSDMQECQEMKATIHGISPEIFKLVLDVIYGSCEALVPDKMIDIWKAAHQLQIESLISTCEDYFMTNINVDNCYSIYTLAQLLQSTKVSSSVVEYIIKKFDSFVTSENFFKLDCEDLLIILDLEICADFKMDAILAWCASDNKTNACKSLKTGQGCSRDSFLGTLIQRVNLAELTLKCLASLLTNPFIQKDKTVSLAVNSQAARTLVSQEDKINYFKDMWESYNNPYGVTDYSQDDHENYYDIHDLLGC